MSFSAALLPRRSWTSPSTLCGCRKRNHLALATSKPQHPVSSLFSSSIFALPTCTRIFTGLVKISQPLWFFTFHHFSQMLRFLRCDTSAAIGTFSHFSPTSATVFPFGDELSTKIQNILPPNLEWFDLGRENYLDWFGKFLFTWTPTSQSIRRSFHGQGITSSESCRPSREGAFPPSSIRNSVAHTGGSGSQRFSLVWYRYALTFWHCFQWEW